jgi:tetrahydromethanopterin S-methyltransferase subunit A
LEKELLTFLVSLINMNKVKPHANYPPEEGRYLRGNDASPVAVVIILNHDEDKIPPEIEALVRAGVEGGAALSGTLQTPNLGLEKMICNIVANPNIRHLVLSGPESEGHLTGEAIKSLFKNGVDEKKNIIDSEALHPVLYNISREFIERFREQLTMIDLQFKGSPQLIKKAVWACYQEEPTEFEVYQLYDPGAFGRPALDGNLMSQVAESWKLPKNEKEIDSVEKMQAMVAKIIDKQANQ